MKKLTALTLALALGLRLLAGGAGGGNDSAPADNTDNAATEPADTGDAAEPEAPADTAPADDAAAEDTGVMTHDEYIAAAIDDPVVIETYVQATQAWWDDSITVYGQSPDGAYFIYNMACSEEDAAKLVPGTKIRVTGFKTEWSGEVEVAEGATFEFVDDGDTFIAEPTDVTELLGTDELIDHQNEYVSFKGLTVEKIEYKNGTPGDDIYVTFGYNGASYDFCVELYLTDCNTPVYITVGELAEGDVVDVEGFLYWYEGVNTHITGITKAA